MVDLAVTPPASPPEANPPGFGRTEAVDVPCENFDELVTRHQERIARLVSRLLGWRGDVDDVVQDVFLAACGAWPRFRRESRPETWLTRIALNACRSHVRRRRLRLWLTRGSAAEQEPVAAAAPGDSADRETLEVVRQAVRGLAGKYREVIVLYYLEQRTTQEISDLLGVRLNTVQVRLSRARTELRKALGDATFDKER